MKSDENAPDLGQIEEWIEQVEGALARPQARVLIKALGYERRCELANRCEGIAREIMRAR